MVHSYLSWPWVWIGYFFPNDKVRNSLLGLFPVGLALLRVVDTAESDVLSLVAIVQDFSCIDVED